MNDRELMQMALDALMTCQEDWIFDGEDERPVDTYDEKMVSAAFKALRARLAQPEPEPVAWMHDSHVGFNVPLYTASPQREWQTLTENEIKHLWYAACQTNLELTSQLIVHLARNIEAKLKEMNSA